MIEDILIKNILKEARIYNHVGHETECNFLKKGKRKCSCEWGEYEEYLTKLIKKALTQVQEEAKREMEEDMRCDGCKKVKPDVCIRPDSYAIEIHCQSDATHKVCDDCDYENRMDI